MKNNKGFTLIEMLVVIAIIGLLSSVVLVALGPSRTKAKDARIISDLNQVKVLEETLFSNGKYTSLDLTTGNGKALDDDIKANNDGTGITLVGAGGTSAYAAHTKLNVGGYYCVDSAGKSVTLAATTNIVSGDCK